MAEKKGNSKIVWIILFAIVTVLLCYLFTVVYFFFISPYNISLKLGFWPFASEQSIGDMYMDAVVQINYKATDDHFEEVYANVTGVNVRIDGYILAPLSEFADCSQEAQIKVFTNGGTAYNGQVVSEDKNRNLAIIKCKNMDGSNKKIKLPYVGIGKLSDCSEGTKVIVTSLNAKARTLASSVTSGVIDESMLTLTVPKDVDGERGYDFTVSNGFVVETNASAALNGGAAFNKKGKLLGFSFGRLVEASLPAGQGYFQPVYGTNDYIKTVVSNKGKIYENKLVDAFCGFDSYEADDMVQTWAQGRDTFYFDDTWNIITEEVIAFSCSGDKGFHLYKPFEYDGKIIPAHSAITRVKIGKINQKIEWRCDLIDTLFKAKKGDTVVLTYVELESQVPKTLSFTV